MSQSTAMVVSRWSVNLTTHFLGKLRPKRLTCTYRVGQLLVTVERIVHIFSPVTNNCPTWISGRGRMAVEIISWPISTKECCQTRGSNLQPAGPLARLDEPPSGMQTFAGSILGSSKTYFVETGHEILSFAILSLLLIQVGQLSVTGERMYTKYWITAYA